MASVFCSMMYLVVAQAGAHVVAHYSRNTCTCVIVVICAKVM